MIVVVALAAVAVGAVGIGGDLRTLAELRVHAVWAAVLALVLQIGIINVFEHRVPHAIAVGIHLLSYGFAGWFVVANRRIRGLRIVALGAVLNLAAIAANNGVMPASPDAARIAGHDRASVKFVNSISTPDAHLAFLGDIFAIPARYPLANVFSIGDIVLVAGAALVLHTASRPRRHAPIAPTQPAFRLVSEPLTRAKSDGSIAPCMFGEPAMGAAAERSGQHPR